MVKATNWGQDEVWKLPFRPVVVALSRELGDLLKHNSLQFSHLIVSLLEYFLDSKMY